MLLSCIIVHTCVILLGLSVAGLFPDYEYIRNFGWMRFHNLPATWADARLRCNMEGGILASPTMTEVIDLIKTTMTRQNLGYVFVDVHASKPKGNFTSLDGKPLLHDALKWEDQEPNNIGNDEECVVMARSGKLADVSCTSVYPYLCIKSNITIKKCDTSNKDYTLEPRTQSCYKFHPEPVPWRRAFMICGSEHAQLAVINSQEEAKVLSELFAKYPPTTMKGAAYDGTYAHIGFVDWEEEREWWTIFGVSLEQAGYAMWEEDQPDNNSGQFCGSMSRDAELNDVSCVREDLPFICETTIKYV